MNPVDLAVHTHIAQLRQRVRSTEEMGVLMNRIVTEMQSAGATLREAPLFHTESNSCDLRFNGAAKRSAWVEVWYGTCFSVSLHAKGQQTAQDVAQDQAVAVSTESPQLWVDKSLKLNYKADRPCAWMCQGVLVEKIPATPEGALSQVLTDIKDFLKGGDRLVNG